MIQYKYAFDHEENVIDVKSLTRGKEIGKYHCIGCGNELIPNLGKIYRKHFKHKQALNCSPETYLHKLAKKLFLCRYKKCLDENEPYILEYSVHRYCNHYENNLSVDCDLGPQKREYDLTSYFENIEVEKRDGNLIPDLRIYNQKTGESIYIEIAVTHESDNQKITSGNRIIEFLIDTEEDLELFFCNRISIDDKRIKRFNFKGDYEKENFCNGNCDQVKSAFIVYNSGKCIITEKPLNALSKIAQSNSLLEFKINEPIQDYDDYISSIFIESIINAHENGIKVKNCFLCRYHAVNSNVSTNKQYPVFCKFLKKPCKSNEGADCEYYRPDRKAYSQHLNENSPKH